MYVCLSAFIAANGMDTMRRLLVEKDISLQKTALRIIHRVFVFRHLLTKCLGSVQISNMDNISHLSSFIYKQADIFPVGSTNNHIENAVLDNVFYDYCPSIHPFIWYVVEICQTHEQIDEYIIEVLFEILIDEVDITEGTRKTSTRLDNVYLTQHTENGKLQLMNKTITQPYLIPLILYCTTKTNESVVESVMRNFILLLQSNHTNCFGFFASSGFYHWFLPTFVCPKTKKLISAEGNIFKLSLTVLALLSYQWMYW